MGAMLVATALVLLSSHSYQMEQSVFDATAENVVSDFRNHGYYRLPVANYRNDECLSPMLDPMHVEMD